MKKVLSVFALLLVVCLGLCSCSPLNPFDYVELGEYKGVTVEFNQDYSVTDEEVDAAIMEQLVGDAKEKQEVTDRAAAKYDIVNVDYVGKIDGTKFEGGSAKDADITILDNSGYIEGFAEALIGHKTGETFDAEVTFPENYGKADLAGKKAVFTFTINKISEYVLPELTDEYVSGAYDYTTVAAWKAAVKEDLEADKKETAISERDKAVWDTVMKNAKFAETLPQSEINAYIDEQMATVEMYASYYSMTVADLLKQQGYTEESYRKELQSYAENYVKEKLVLMAIAEAEGLTIDDEYYIKNAGAMAEEYSYSSLTEFEGDYGKEAIRKQMLWDRISAFLIENCKTVDPSDK